jgi:hypothetical protein
MILPKVSKNILGHDIAKSIPKYLKPWHIAHDMLWNIVAAIVLKSGAHVQREVSHLFPAIHGDEWILSSLKMIFEFWEMCHCQSNSYRFGVACFDDDNACSNSCCSK